MNKSTGRRRRGNKTGKSQPEVFQNPSPNLINFKGRKVLRYLITAGAAGTAFTVGNLFQSYVMKSSGAAVPNAVLAFSSIRLKKVEIWGVANNITTAPAWDWFAPAANFGVPDMTVNRATTNTASSPHLIMRPPSGSIWRNWINPANTAYTSDYIIGNLTAPAGSIVDVSYDYLMSDGQIPTLVASANITALAAGQFCQSPAAGWVPAEYPTYI